MNKKLSDNQIEIIETKLKKKRNSIAIYVELMSSNNIDDDYKKNYKKYYTMNRSFKLNDKNYYDTYFSYLEELKKTKKVVNFGDVIRFLTKNTEVNFISPSYSSKLLATLNPNKPVWDTNVLIQLNNGLYEEYKSAQNKYYKTKEKDEYIDTLIKIYDKLEATLNKEYLNCDIGKSFINIFDKIFKDYPEFLKIKEIKKIDIVLWSLGNKTI